MDAVLWATLARTRIDGILFGVFSERENNVGSLFYYNPVIHPY